MEPLMINRWRKGDFGRLALMDTDYGLLLMSEREWAMRRPYGENGARVVEVSLVFTDGTAEVLVPAELVAEIHAFITEPFVFSQELLDEMGEKA